MRISDWSSDVCSSDLGRQVFIEFPGDIASGVMPPLFVIGADQAAELVNYRVQVRYMVVDRLFERAELRLGAGNSAKQVRIERERARSEEHTSELQSLMRISYAVFCLKKKN